MQPPIPMRQPGRVHLRSQHVCGIRLAYPAGAPAVLQRCVLSSLHAARYPLPCPSGAATADH